MTRIAAIHYSNYPLDVRPRREAEALVESGMSVDIICLRLVDQEPKEIINGVRVHRIPMQKVRAGKLSYILQYLDFFLRVFLKLSIMHFRNRYDVIHVHNMPDFLVFTALLPKLFGSKIVLDLHDPMPELYMTKYAIGDDSAIIKLLKSLERWSINFADIVITPNIAFRNLFISRGCPAEKIHIVMNSPMESVFHTGTGDSIKADQNKADGFVIMFHGGIYERHGLDTALEVIANLRNEIPNIRFKVFGDGDYETQFMKLIDEHDLKSIVSYRGTVPLETISEEIRSIDVGIIPNKKNPFTDINFPVRIFEYLCLNKPVIVPRTRGIMDYFDDDSLFFFEPGNAESLAQALLKIHRNPVLCQEVNERAACVYSRYRWALQRQYLLELVGGLLAK